MATELVSNGLCFTEESVLQTEVTEDSKNKNTIKCLRCPSCILKPGVGKLAEIRFDLPDMRKKRDVNPDNPSEGDIETLNHFWLVPDMYMFENVGFSHTVGNVKYLTCADCEVGPIGWYDQDTKNCHVALNRVKYTP